MKQFLFTLCIAALGASAAFSQTVAPAPGKSSGKKPVAPASAAQPKPRLLTLDQLRRCFKLNDDNATEAEVLKAEKAQFEEEHGRLVADQAALLKRSEILKAEAKAVVTEQEELVIAAKEFAQPVERSEVKATEARRVAYNERIEINKKRVDDFNAAKDAFNAAKAQFDPRIEASNARSKALQHRIEEHNYGLEDWRAECANRPYSDADEALIKKEKAR